MRTMINYVVGIGASAGGLEAIQELFNSMPNDTGLTFIVVQHLSPDFKSMMRELLARNTSSPIVIADNNTLLEAGVIYLIPASFSAQISNNRFILTKLKRNSLKLPISGLFKSIAINFAERSIGVILSGTGSDGALGMKEIANHNGLTIVQAPSEAKFSDMPTNSIATGDINCILFASEIAATIIEYIDQPADFNKELKQINLVSKNEYSRLFHLLERKYAVNFASYKLGTISRRIQRRMRLLNIDELPTYLDKLSHDELALKTLYQDLLIGVTEFFRDQEAFKVLASDIVPLLFNRYQTTQEEIRIWINACASGEEAYSIAIIFKEYADAHNLPFAVKLFASDVSADFIQQAKKGLYSEQSIARIPAEIVNKYFIKSKHLYEIIPEIKQKILFTRHNLLQDPPFTKMDLVCCRNLLIYITPQEQKRITDMLRFSLNIGGFLFLGPSESLANLAPDLVVKNQLWRIFNKTKRSPFPLISPLRIIQPLTEGTRSSANQHAQPGAVPVYAYNAILHDLIGAGFIIDSAYTVLHSIGKGREILRFPEGAPTLILTKIIHNDLKSALITALHKAQTSLVPVVYDNIAVEQAFDKKHTVKITIHPIIDSTNKISHYWIRLEASKALIKKPTHLLISATTHQADNNELILSLEAQLSETKNILQTSLENTETIHEEMQSTNEELMASNEELQSSNEELQSVNEELYNVNSERSKKIDEVIQSKTDIDNLIRGADICTIILNEQLEIRIFTPAAEKIFNLVSHDVGRPLKNFQHKLKFNELMQTTDEVLKQHTTFEKEIKDTQNHWYLIRILPYYAANHHHVTGVVISLTDINESKLLQQTKDQIEKELRLTLKTGLIGIWRYCIETNRFTYDDTIKNLFGLADLNTMNQAKLFFKAIHPDDKKRIKKVFSAIISKIDNFEESFRIQRPDKTTRYLSCSANRYENLALDLNYIIGICWDMTALKEKEETLEHLAYRDSLTQLANRSYFLEELLRAIDRAKRVHRKFAVMFIDIDNFKAINDEFGHTVGDKALVAFANKLIRLSRTIDIIARLGGDEFAILLEAIENKAEIEAIAGRYISACREALLIDDKSFVITISIGIAIYPDNGNNDLSLLKYADKTMYQAKQQGKNRFVLA